MELDVGGCYGLNVMPAGRDMGFWIVILRDLPDSQALCFVCVGGVLVVRGWTRAHSGF